MVYAEENGHTGEKPADGEQGTLAAKHGVEYGVEKTTQIMPPVPKVPFVPSAFSRSLKSCRSLNLYT